MNPKVLASFAIFVLLFGVVSSVAFADEKTDQKSKETRQQAAQSKSTNNSEIKNCASNLELLRKLLDDASQKASALKEKLYAEWKSKYSSGQIKDDWDVYSKKLETSQEMIGYRQTQEKYNLILASCADNSQSKPPESRVQFTSSEECVSAQKTIESIDQRYSVLKQKAYDDWKSQNAAGTYTGTWEQYADEKLIKSTDVLELGKMREKYEPFLRTCYVQSGASSDVSQTKPLLQTPKTTDQKSPAKITQKPAPPVSKTDKKPYGVTDDSAKKSDKSIKLTKAKPDKLIKKPQRQFVQK
jgi:hypothetical protein